MSKQLPLDPNNKSEPFLSVAVVQIFFPTGKSTIVGIFRHDYEAKEFVKLHYRDPRQRRVMGTTVFDLADGETVEIDIWAVR